MIGKTKSRDFLKNIIPSVIGPLIVSAGTALFVLPFNLVTGGVSGVALIISGIFPNLITTDLLIAIITWLLFFLGLIFLGKPFAIKTFVSSLIYPLGISFFSWLRTSGVLDGFFNINNSPYANNAIILAAFCAGILSGTGCALTFLGGGSTGGMDVLAFLICKIFKIKRSSAVVFLLDAITVTAGAFVFKDIVITLLGIVTAAVGAIVIDKVFLGESKAFIAQIVSDKYEQINQAVIQKLKRTTTIITVQGGYSKQMHKMISVSFSMREYSELLNLVSAIDDNAFITVHKAHEINGQGWTK